MTKAMTPSPDTPEGLLRKQFEALRDFPADGRPDRKADPETMILLIVNGYVEKHEQTKACPCCGTPKLDYSYFRITNAGKLFCGQFATIERLTEREKVLRGTLERLTEAADSLGGATNCSMADDAIAAAREALQAIKGDGQGE